jgi:hypothetical protein
MIASPLPPAADLAPGDLAEPGDRAPEDLAPGDLAPGDLAPGDPLADAGEPLPVLEEVPELAAALELARRIDRLVAQLVSALSLLEEHALAEHLTGVPLEQWLAIVGRRTGADRRMLMTTCEVLRRLPSLRQAFLTDASVSWAQVRTIVLRVHRLPHHLDDAIDDELARAIRDAADADPDALGYAVTWALGGLDPAEQESAQRVAEEHEFLALQPRLDGSGGRVWGDFGPVGFARLDAALEVQPPTGTRTREGFGAAPDAAAARDVASSAGRRRAERLLELLEHRCDAPAATAGSRTPAPPQLLLRTDLATLLDRSSAPASLLTSLTGGRMWVDAATARRLVAERGADLRTVVLDETGGVVGVGRASRVPPGWLRDAVLALHDTCSAPGCHVAARVCDVDHAVPWHPARPGDRPGRTDVDQLAPLCRTDNRTKEAAGWTVSQRADGTRVWRHARTGLETRTHPATWRAPPARGP